METKGIRISQEEYAKMMKKKRQQEIKQARDSAYYKQYPHKLKEKAELELIKLRDKEANKPYAKSKLDRERAFWIDPKTGEERIHRTDITLLPKGQSNTVNTLEDQRLRMIAQAKADMPQRAWPRIIKTINRQFATMSR